VFTLSVTIPDEPHIFLDEWGTVSLLSGFQLLTCGFIALEIHKSRPAWLWRLMGWGFFFRCADEMLQLHESADRLIHWIFGIHETAFTDQLDDLFVGLYGLAGLAALIAGRAELVFFRRHWWLFALGFLGLVGTVVFDFLEHKSGLVALQLDITPRQAAILVEVIEEGCKLAGGFAFVAALRRCWEGLQLPSARPHSNAETIPA
jgi:hypothetical protein